MDGGWNEGRQRLGVWRSSTGLAPGPSKRTPSFPSHRHLGQAAPGRRRSRLNSIAPTWHPILPVPAAGPLVCLGDSPALGRAPAHPAPPRPTPPKSGSATRLRGRPRVRPQGRQSSRWTVCPHLLPTFWADPPAVLTAADAMELRSSPTRFSPHHFGTAGAGEGKFIRPKLGRILLIQSSCSLAESTWHSAVSRSPIGLNGALSKFGGFHPFGTSQSRVTADGFRDPAKQLFVPVCGEAGTSRSVR